MSRDKKSRVDALNKIGFIWARLQPEWNLIFIALNLYAMERGNLEVPKGFVVPTGNSYWPEETWGLRLGYHVYRIRIRHHFLRGEEAPERWRMLDSLGFIWDVDEYRFEKFCCALRWFKKVEVPKRKQDGASVRGILKIPVNFVVPSGKENGWPRRLWGYRLGVQSVAVRQTDTYLKRDRKARLERLKNLGFYREGNDFLRWLEFAHAATIYSRLHNRTLNVPEKYVVASGDSLDPEVRAHSEHWPGKSDCQMPVQSTTNFMYMY